jgi:hypothetical protein
MWPPRTALLIEQGDLRHLLLRQVSHRIERVRVHPRGSRCELNLPARRTAAHPTIWREDRAHHGFSARPQRIVRRGLVPGSRQAGETRPVDVRAPLMGDLVGRCHVLGQKERREQFHTSEAMRLAAIGQRVVEHAHPDSAHGVLHVPVKGRVVGDVVLDRDHRNAVVGVGK